MATASEMAGTPEFPSPAKQRLLGEFLFLAMRSDTYSNLPLNRFQEAFEPAIDLKQFHLFRFDDIPRGVVTWARLTPGAESRFIRGQGLKPEDWNKGDRFWVVDLIAPYKGVGPYITRWGRQPGNLPTRKVRYLRPVRGTAEVQKIGVFDMDAPAGSQLQTFSKHDYLESNKNQDS